MTQATIKNISHEAFKSKSHGIFLCQHPLHTNSKSPILELLYILYLYIFMLNLPSLLPYNQLSSWRWEVIGQGEESPSERKKIYGMDLIKYIPYIRATPQSLLKRTEGLLTIKKIMSYGVNGVSYLKERRVSKLQGTYNVLP